MTKASSDVRQTLHRRQGVRHRAEGCMALRWWLQCRKRSLRGTRQHPVICMPSPHMGPWFLLYRYTISYPKFWKPKSSENRKFFSWRSSAHQSSRLGQRCLDETHTQSTPRRCVASRRSKLGLQLHPAGCVTRVLPVSQQGVMCLYCMYMYRCIA
jgi:hypothetical protein